MITSVRLRNFKSFKDTGKVALAPLTVLTGRNSSGKSALIRALMALRQTTESTDALAAFAPRGAYVDLGDFPDFVFKYDTKSRVLFDIDCTVYPGPNLYQGIAPFLDPRVERKLTISIELGFVARTRRTYLVESTVEKLEEGISVHRASKGGRSVSRSYKTTVSLPEREPIVLADAPTAKFFATPPFNTFTRLELDDPQSFIGSELSKDIGDSIVQEFSMCSYIGPLRAPAERIYISAGETPREVGSAGQFGPAVLWSASSLPRLNLKEALSDWCRRMEIADEIKLETLYGSFFEIDAVDPALKIPVNLPDVGFGTSQLLPVLIQGLIASRGSTLLLEQPEIHLHPKVQAELADFLIDVSQREVGVVVETHSEHLITRIQRRIAEGNLLPDAVALYYFTSSPDGSEITRVHLDEFGQIEAAPDGFFEEGFEETFALMRALGERKARQE